jgi:hypothetical protein
MLFRANLFRVVAVAGCCVLQRVAPLRAQTVGTAQSAPRWVTDVELTALRHSGGAVGADEPGRDLGGTGFEAGAGIGWLAANGAGLRVSVRGFGVPDSGHDGPTCVPVVAGSSGGEPCIAPGGPFGAVGLSLDLASGISSEGVPLGLEIGPDAFRTVARPHAGRVEAPPSITAMGAHLIGVLAPGRQSPWALTGGAQWLSGNIAEWLFPVGLRFSF